MRSSRRVSVSICSAEGVQLLSFKQTAPCRRSKCLVPSASPQSRYMKYLMAQSVAFGAHLWSCSADLGFLSFKNLLKTHTHHKKMTFFSSRRPEHVGGKSAGVFVRPESAADRQPLRCIGLPSVAFELGRNLISAVITCLVCNRITAFVTSFGALEHLKYEITGFEWRL